LVKLAAVQVHVWRCSVLCYEKELWPFN